MTGRAYVSGCWTWDGLCSGHLRRTPGVPSMSSARTYPETPGTALYVAPATAPDTAVVREATGLANHGSSIAPILRSVTTYAFGLEGALERHGFCEYHDE